MGSDEPAKARGRRAPRRKPRPLGVNEEAVDLAPEKLGLARATMVRDFLVKYGARANQMDVISMPTTS